MPLVYEDLKETTGLWALTDIALKETQVSS
jgi:hypothetical protein